MVPPDPPVKLPLKLPARVILKASEAIAKQPSLVEASALDHLVSYLFLRREAVESSRMEGTLSTINHILTPGELFSDWKAKSEDASVRGYASALEDELKQVKKVNLNIFSADLILRLHKATMALDPRFRGVPRQLRDPSLPGEIVWIRGKTSNPEDSIYNPVLPHHIPRCLKTLIDWFKNEALILDGDAGMGMPLPVRMAIGHAHFEAIHPFTDGNGRVGRMLLALLDSGRESNRTSSCIKGLPKVWLERGNFRKGSTAERALSWLIEHPIFTVKQLQEKIQVSEQAALMAVDQLLEQELIRERTGFERNRVFAAEEVISLLSRQFDSDPDEAIESARLLLKKP